MRLFSVALCVLLATTQQVLGDEPTPPRPIAEQALVFPKWEYTSVSPFGGSRLGGSDRRPFRFTPDGRQIVGMDGGAWRFQRFDVATGASLGMFGKTRDAGDIAIATDGRHMISLAGHTVHLWDLEQLRYLQAIDEGANFINFSAAAFLDHRRCLLAGNDDKKYQICVWDIETGTELENYTVQTALKQTPRARALAVAPSSRLIAVVEDQQVVLRERYSGQLRALLTNLPVTVDTASNSVDMMAFSHDGRWLAVTYNSAVYLLDVITGEELPPLVAGGRVRALYFSADGQHLQTLADDHRLLTWAIRDITQVLPAAEAPAKEKIAELIEATLNDDPWRGYLAKRQLGASPVETADALRKRLPPVQPINTAQLQAITDGLLSDDFNQRKSAVRAMKGREDQVFAAMKKRGNEDAFGERRDRSPAGRERAARWRNLEWNWSERFGVSSLPEKDAAENSPAMLLMRVGSPEAQQVLKEIAAGAPTATRTKIAQQLLSQWPEAASGPLPANVQERVKLLGNEAAAPAWQVATLLVRDWQTERQEARKELMRLAALPTLGVNQEEVGRLLKQLDVDDFQEREAASQRLAQLGRSAEPMLRAARANAPTPEATSRIDALLKSLQPREILPDERCAQRLLEVVVFAEGPKSELLQEVAKAAQSGWLRSEVKALLAGE